MSIISDFSTVENIETVFLEALGHAGVVAEENRTQTETLGEATKEHETREKPPSRKRKAKGQKQEATRPCIKALLEGVPKGERNDDCIRIASDLLSRSLTIEQTLEVLKQWNAKNQPPLSEEEIVTIWKSAIGNQYNYGCEDEILKKHCVGKDKCPLFISEEEKKTTRKPFVELPDGKLAEQAFDGETTYFLIYNPQTNTATRLPEIELELEIIKPIDNDEIRNGTVLLPSDAKEYQTEEQLTKDIEEFLDYWHESPDELSRLLDTIYAILSYMPDLLPQVPYRSMLAECGKGKTTWLMTLGSICYRPVILSGSDTDKSIVRKMHNWRGTALIDEADFSKSDLYGFLIKILNCGFDRSMGWYQRASEEDPFEVLQYYVYSCKLLARRSRYKDMALESRCLTSIGKENLADVPMFRLETFKKQAQSLRNKLILWRFRNFEKTKEKTKRLEEKGLVREIFGDSEESKNLSSRVKQIIMPLWLLGDEHLRSQLKELANRVNADLRTQDNRYLLELDAKEAIKSLWKQDQKALEMEVDSLDKGIVERKGFLPLKARTSIYVQKLGNEEYYTVSLSEISKKIIVNKGTEETQIERKDIISYSKTLKALFESRLGLRFQIGKKHERVVLMPKDWFNKLLQTNLE